MTIGQLSEDPAEAEARRRWRIVIAIAVSTLAVLAAFGWWASHEGYVTWFGTACTDEGFVGPTPSYEDMITKYGMSPYCAREARGETWF